MRWRHCNHDVKLPPPSSPQLTSSGLMTSAAGDVGATRFTRIPESSPAQQKNYQASRFCSFSTQTLQRRRQSHIPIFHSLDPISRKVAQSCRNPRFFTCQSIPIEGKLVYFLFLSTSRTKCKTTGQGLQPGLLSKNPSVVLTPLPLYGNGSLKNKRGTHMM